MKEKNKKKGNLIFLLKLIYKSSPQLVFFEFIWGLSTGIWNAADVIFVKLFYDYLSNEGSFHQVFVILIVMIAFFALYQLWFQLSRLVIRPILQQKLKLCLHKLLFDTSKEADLSSYDNPEFYDNYVWVLNQSDNQANRLLMVISNITVMVVTIIATVGILSSISYILAIIAILSAICTIFFRKMLNKNIYERDVYLTPLSKEKAYYERLYGTPDYAKEVRIRDVFGFFQNQYIQNQRAVLKVKRKYAVIGLKYEIPLKLIGELMQPIVYALLLYQIVVTGTATIGGLAVAFASFWNLRGRLQAIIDLSANLSQISEYTERVRIFLEQEPNLKGGTEIADQLVSLEFCSVSFAYERNRNVLDNISLKIRKGEKIAIVGDNGAGKSTFLKLLMRLYDPSDGVIIYNGKPLRTYDIDSYRKHIGVIFQDFQIYELSIAENVLADCYNASPDEKKNIFNSLRKASFDISDKQYSQGIATPLGREFNEEGVILSGGNSQKIAIARALSHDYNLLLMDEPSASLDVNAEYELNNAIKTYAQDKAIIFISHRLSTTRLADCIYVFENGKIVEFGSHEALMACNGKYAEMYRLQASQYL